MNDLVLTDSALRDVSIPAQKRFDLAFGADENDFELTLPLSEAELSVGDCFYFANTEWGGVIDRRTFNFGANRSITYYGRSWHGILAGSVLCPNAGTDYLTYSGDLHAILRTVVARQGLQGVAQRSVIIAFAVSLPGQRGECFGFADERACQLLADLCVSIKEQPDERRRHSHKHSDRDRGPPGAEAQLTPVESVEGAADQCRQNPQALHAEKPTAF